MRFSVLLINITNVQAPLVLRSPKQGFRLNTSEQSCLSPSTEQGAGFGWGKVHFFVVSSRRLCFGFGLETVLITG